MGSQKTSTRVLRHHRKLKPHRTLTGLVGGAKEVTAIRLRSFAGNRMWQVYYSILNFKRSIITLRGQSHQGGWYMIRTCCIEQGNARFDGGKGFPQKLLNFDHTARHHIPEDKSPSNMPQIRNSYKNFHRKSKGRINFAKPKLSCRNNIIIHLS